MLAVPHLDDYYLFMKQKAINQVPKLDDLAWQKADLTELLANDYPEPMTHVPGSKLLTWEDSVRLMAHARSIVELFVPDLTPRLCTVSERAMRFANSLGVALVERDVRFSTADYWEPLMDLSDNVVRDTLAADAQAYLSRSPRIADIITEFIPHIDPCNVNPYVVETVAAYGTMIIEASLPTEPVLPGSVYYS